MNLITRLRVWFDTNPNSENTRPVGARMTTPAERAPLHAAYAAARQYERDNPGAEFTDDGIIQAAVNAYEKTKTGGTAVTPRPTPGAVTVGGSNHGNIATHVTLPAPDRAGVLGPWLRHVGDHTAYRSDRRGTYD